ncbi:hypothetical protein AMEX_G15068 [Astyanax mexicanus]|uniref:UBZ2-type domain-containing protein n=1 Tax=Astyanax mexicanus TaxID=7994 RepID=A0A8T2LF45_ASTMX|nr:hypothetical protein AMEX_G15068 [Astyanax mexicanus]
MSKLKRKRVSVAEESKPEGKPEIRNIFQSLRNPGGTSSSKSCSSAGHRGDGGEPWWAATELTAEEKIWMTLQGFCPEAFSSPASVYCVPELPQLPEKAEEEKQSEWRWCRLDEEVPELPVLKDLQSCAPNHCTKPCVPNSGSLQTPSSPVKQLSQTRHEPIATTSQRPLEDNPKSSETREGYQATSSQHPLKDDSKGSRTRHDEEVSISQHPVKDNSKGSETRHDQEVSISQRPLKNNSKGSETRHKQQISSSQHPLKDNLKSKDTRCVKQASNSLSPAEDHQKSCPTPKKFSEKPDPFREGESQQHGSMLIKKSQKSEGGKSKSKVKLTQGDTKIQTTDHHTSKADIRKVTHLQAEKMLGKEFEGKSGTGLQCESKSRSLVSKLGSASGAGSGSGSGSRDSSLEINADGRPGTSSGGCVAGPAEPKLECCPMCLMPFPAGFSQMDCDGHLAQCLSEMNMDMVW